MKSLYKWHRILSLVIAVPLVLSAGSGIMHPIMTNIRPSLATQGIKPIPIDSSKIVIPLEDALRANAIDSFSGVRIIHIDTSWFYQVQRTPEEIPLYFSTLTGKMLPRGDWIYGQYLARQFLEGPVDSKVSKAAGLRDKIIMENMPDCCNAATSAVLNAKGAKVSDEVRLTHFDEEYNDINRLLPVYKISFDRPDGIRVYVETIQDRFAFAVDDRRALFNKVFEFIHTWSWLDFLGWGKLVFEFLLVFTAFIVTILGVYIFFATRSKKVSGNGYVKARRNHRYTAIVISLFTLMFTFSGGYHALYKLKADTREQYYVRNRFSTGDIHFHLGSLARCAGQPVAGVGIIAMGGERYWQVTTLPAAGPAKGYHKDLMMDMHAPLPRVYYINTTDYSVLRDGDAHYADYLSTKFSGHGTQDILSTSAVTSFGNEYNFTDKRLPVWRVSYASNHHERFFVETSTGRLSVRVDDLDVLEGYSFALLHKHEFLGWAGKSVKDYSTMFWAAAQIVLVLFGLILYIKWWQRRKQCGTAG